MGTLRNEPYSHVDSDKNTSRVLGAAFLLQAITSLSSGLILKLVLTVPGNISQSVIRIANNAWLMKTSLFVDMLTAFGVIFLGAILFITLRKQNEPIALVALGFYVSEAALNAASKIPAFSLLRTSQEYAAAAHPAFLETIGSLAFESMDFVGTKLTMLCFCLGAILFYYLIDKSRIVPRALSLWGLITVFPCLVGTLFAIFGYEVPFAVYVPYAPFEFTIGVWILVEGISDV
jgi:hypothetical protein